MPFQNRVTPLGELIATPERGLVYGNRGRLHDEQGNIRRQRHVKRWISCRLEFRGRHRPRGPMAPIATPASSSSPKRPRWLPDTAPCAECRNPAYESFLALTGASHAGELDETLHAECSRLHEYELDALPDGAFAVLGDDPWLVLGAKLLRWTPGGYSERRPRFSGRVQAATPPTQPAHPRLGLEWKPAARPSGPVREKRAPIGWSGRRWSRVSVRL